MVNSSSQVLATLAYSDIFEYPLTREEIEKYLVGEKQRSPIEILNALNNENIQKKGTFYFLRNRQNIVASRLEKEKISKKKFKKAEKIAKQISVLPSILYLGISGSLAMQNAKEDDDIDFFIITKTHTLWLSRLLITCWLFLTGNLRRYASADSKNTICTNMWMDAAHMKFPEKRRNIYTAHEIVQMRTLYQKGKTLQYFLFANNWIKDFLPNTCIQQIDQKYSRQVVWIKYLEVIAKNIQLFYMKKHRTSETITDGFVAFHPEDYTKSILRKWKEKTYGI